MRLLPVLCSLLPSSGLRCLGYRLLGVTVRRSFIGYATVIDVKSAIITDSRVGRMNRFEGPMSLNIQSSFIGPRNQIRCGAWAHCYEAFCDIRQAHVSAGHYIDAVGGFRVGAGSWLAGVGSQFWTHGAGAADRSVFVGRNCYIGSGVLFAPGSSVSDGTIVSLGSVVTQRFTESNCLVGGVPARVLKRNHDWRTAWDGHCMAQER